jgi:serine protease Do
MASAGLKVVVGTIAGGVLGAALALSGSLTRLGVPARAPAPTTAPETAATAPSARALATDDPALLGQEPHSRFAILAEKAAAGVVNVHTSKTVTQAPFEFPFPDLFRQFFGQGGPGGPGPQQQQPRSFTVPSLGTGFVISDDGYIVTNNHVVADVDEVQVTFSDGRQAKATIVGQDPKTDIALIRVEGLTGLTSLPLGDSEAILPGDWVVAIGNPFGLDHTVTVGIVSAKGRDIGQGPYDDYIQTDAAINPGNSGGPLLDIAGNVIGINSAINPQANTIGFAVPINMAKAILPQLREKGSVTRGWLGVAVQPITPELADAFKLDKSEGALVAQVSPGSPADQAGIKRGDVIVRFGNEKITKMRELPAIVSSTPVDQEVPVEVIREGRHETMNVKVGKLDEEPTQIASKQSAPGGTRAFGMRVEDLTPAIAQRLGVEDQGALVADVESDGPAARAGIRPGDVVVEVDRKPVKSAGELAKALDASASRALLLVRRGDNSLYVAVERSSS